MSNEGNITDNEPAASPYAWYVLTVLVIVYMLNFIDRQILSILAEDIKRDLKLSDGDLGFLFGTAFGVFYALFGIPLGRLADNWHRIRLITTGLTLWSAMTALSGFSMNLWQLSVARIGVGVGEASAAPSAYSILSDYFPKRQRATALAIYSSGLYLGGGLSLSIGGLVVGSWNHAFPNGGPLGLVGWQAAFMAVGIPGILIALWVSTLREPKRGAMDGVTSSISSSPFHDFGQELISIIPPLTLIGASRRGPRALIINLAVATVSGLVAFGMIRATGNIPQWVAVGIGAYAVFSWATALKVRDRPTYALIWGTPTFLYVALSYGLIAFVSYGLALWAAPYAERELGQAKAVIGLFIGGGAALSGFLGVNFGGWLADRLRRTNPSGRILVIMIGAAGPILPIIIAYTTSSATLFYIMAFIYGVLGSSALGAAAATTQDLVLPRMRGTATATFFIGTTLIGLALGPYMAGFVSTVTGSLRTGILSLLIVTPISLTVLFLAYRSLPKATASLIERARAAGEVI
ncbi:MAG: spinster family MFS transporter [Sphingomonadaceae bacterium]